MPYKFKCPRCGAPGFSSFVVTPVDFDENCEITHYGKHLPWKGDMTACCSQHGPECFEGESGEFAYEEEPEEDEPEAPNTDREELQKVLAALAKSMQDTARLIQTYFDKK